jgi:tRNA(Ile)-lysidine synthase
MSPSKKSAHYPAPKRVGGKLIRKLIAEFRVNGVDLPIDSHILIAVSGGADSLALAHLLLKYGRRVVDPTQIQLLHINHGWRGAASDADAQFVQKFAKKWDVPFIGHNLKPPTQSDLRGASWEDAARQARKAIFDVEAVEHAAKILTGHQADDQAETLLWRIFTGASDTHGGGITFAHGVELRPLLSVRKHELKAYLKEERQVWREDVTNAAGRFLRSKMRQTLMPEIESLFPRAVEHLVTLARRASQLTQSQSAQPNIEALGALFSASGIRMRRAHWRAIKRDQLELTLPGGWRLSRQTEGGVVRWVLEAVVSS